MGLNNNVKEGCRMILLAEISQYWRNFVKTVMKFLAPEETKTYRVAERLSCSREEICFSQFLNCVY
jgi:hypothetical protein